MAPVALDSHWRRGDSTTLNIFSWDYGLTSAAELKKDNDATRAKDLATTSMTPWFEDALAPNSFLPQPRKPFQGPLRKVRLGYSQKKEEGEEEVVDDALRRAKPPGIHVLAGISDSHLEQQEAAARLGTRAKSQSRKKEDPPKPKPKLRSRIIHQASVERKTVEGMKRLGHFSSFPRKPCVPSGVDVSKTSTAPVSRVYDLLSENKWAEHIMRGTEDVVMTSNGDRRVVSGPSPLVLDVLGDSYLRPHTRDYFPGTGLEAPALQVPTCKVARGGEIDHQDGGAHHHGFGYSLDKATKQGDADVKYESVLRGTSWVGDYGNQRSVPLWRRKQSAPRHVGHDAAVEEEEEEEEEYGDFVHHGDGNYLEMFQKGEKTKETAEEGGRGPVMPLVWQTPPGKGRRYFSLDGDESEDESDTSSHDTSIMSWFLDGEDKNIW